MRIPRPPAVVINPEEEVIYPDTDPEPMADTPIHVVALLLLINILREWFRSQGNVYVIGNVFWYYQRGDRSARKAPDLMVIKGVDPQRQRRSYKDWETGKVPCFILEALSEDTYKEDMGPKHQLYEQLGVREYFLFDPERFGLEQPLVGYRLRRGVYEELPTAKDGSVHSDELGLRLRPEGDVVTLLNPTTLEPLPDMASFAERLAEAVQRSREAVKALSKERRLVKQERLAKEQERLAKERERLAKERERLAKKQERQAKEQERLAKEQERLAKEDAQRQAEHERLLKEEAEQRAARERRAKEALAKELERLRAQLNLPPEGTDTSVTS